jgi:hypothetical protein
MAAAAVKKIYVAYIPWQSKFTLVTNYIFEFGINILRSQNELFILKLLI